MRWGEGGKDGGSRSIPDEEKKRCQAFHLQNYRFKNGEKGGELRVRQMNKLKQKRRGKQKWRRRYEGPRHQLQCRRDVRVRRRE